MNRGAKYHCSFVLFALLVLYSVCVSAQVTFASFPSSLKSGKCSSTITIARNASLGQSEITINLGSSDKTLLFFIDRNCKLATKTIRFLHSNSSSKFYVYAPKETKQQSRTVLISVASKSIGSSYLILQNNPDFVVKEDTDEVLSTLSSIDKPERKSKTQQPLAKNASFSLAKNEIGSAVLNVNFKKCKTIYLPRENGLIIKLFRLKGVRTTRQSHIGADVGVHLDPLIPIDMTGGQICPEDKWIWMDLSTDEETPAGTYTFLLDSLKVSLMVWNFVLPKVPSLPFYLPISSNKILQAHAMAGNGLTEEKIGVLEEYSQMLRDHRIEPIGQRLEDPSKIIDGSLEFDSNFEKLVIHKAILPICLIFPTKIDTTWKSETILRAWENRIKSEERLNGAWAYVTDEPTDILGTIERLKKARKFAPHLKLMITHEPTEDLLNHVDYFAVNYDQFKVKGHWADFGVISDFWLYGSCMSHGSCVNGKVGRLTGTPDLMLDEPSVFARAYPMVAFALGASSALYYDAVFALKTAWNDQYFFGGNGDGTLLYPGTKGKFGLQRDVPISSIRLKSIRQGLYDIEYIKLARSNGMGDLVQRLVKNQFLWSKKNNDYDNFREQVGNHISNQNLRYTERTDGQ